jgi:hypothetical protein
MVALLYNGLLSGELTGAPQELHHSLLQLNQNHRAIISPHSEWPLSKRQKENAGEDVKKRELLYAASGRINQYRMEIPPKTKKRSTIRFQLFCF